MFWDAVLLFEVIPVDMVRFMRYCEGSLLLTWGNSFLTVLFSELVQLFEGFFASLNCQQQEAIIII